MLRQTVDRVEGLGLRLALLDPWYDVDTVEDLEFLSPHLRAWCVAGRANVAPATSRILEGDGRTPGVRTEPV